MSSKSIVLFFGGGGGEGGRGYWQQGHKFCSCLWTVSLHGGMIEEDLTPEGSG